MSTTRRLFILAGLLLIFVVTEGMISTATHIAHREDGPAIISAVRVILALWLGSALAETLKNNPE